MTAMVVTIFVASLVGSLHCAGMCGGLVALCVGVDDSGRGSRWKLHLAYNGGRLVTYASLGAISGAIGAAVDLGGGALGVSRLAAIIAGAVMILFGLYALARAQGMRVGHVRLPASVEAIFRRGYRAAYDRPPIIRALMIGLLTGFLPCGWLYAFVFTAAGTGNTGMGALVMAAFWFGTLPILMTLGVGVQALAGPLRRHVPTLTACALVFVGVIAIVGRINVPAYAGDVEARLGDGHSHHNHPADGITSLDSLTLPCCDAGE